MALVVTIVVLMILATVSINAVLGENGIIKKAQQARDLYEGSIKAEEEAMNQLLAEYNNMIQNEEDNNAGGENPPVEPELPDNTPTTQAGTQVKPPETWTSDKVTGIADGKGGTVPLPDGFYYVEGNIDTGLVISDKQGDTIDASGVNMGNQFVWIPVSNELILTRTNFDTNGQPTTGLSTDYTEPYASGYATEKAEYNTMRSKVLQYGGFYIGRYEAGINSTELRKAVTTAQEVVSKKGVAPYSYVPWGVAMNNASEVSGQSGAVHLAKSMYNNSESVTSTLVYGCQWDAMCRYIGDSQRTTPTKTKSELTGNVSTDVSKNIYDLAGNCREWTMEACSTFTRFYRGGGTTYSLAINNRNYGTVNTTNFGDGFAFRCTLYIK